MTGLVNYSLSDLLQIPGVALVKKGPVEIFQGVHFDSRLLKEGDLFLVRRGETVDAHEYLEKAYEKGSSVALVESADLALKLAPDGMTLLSHESPLIALQEFAKLVRHQRKTRFIGITGSVGKTTCKDALKAFLGESAYGSVGNYNNFLGLPLCLVNMPADASHGVFEMGISTPGEMDLLCEVLEPPVVVLTGVEESHREFFPCYEDLFREKLQAASRLNERGYFFFPDRIETKVRELYQGNAKLIPVSAQSPDWSELLKSRFGEGPARSIQLAYEVARVLGVPESTLQARLDRITLSPMRMEWREFEGFRALLDCYNASPASTLSFLNSLQGLKNITLVLADMLELGETSEVSHTKALNRLSEFEIERVYLVGENYARAYENGTYPAHWNLSPDRTGVEKEFQTLLPSGILALKGSRAFSLEKLIQCFAATVHRKESPC